MTGVTRLQQPVPDPIASNNTDFFRSATSTEHVAASTKVDIDNEDAKPIKTESDNLVYFDIFGDAYVELLSTPKPEPATEEPLEPKSSVTASQNTLQISDVHTLGITIKEEPDALPSTKIEIDPHCTSINCTQIWILYKRQKHSTSVPHWKLCIKDCK